MIKKIKNSIQRQKNLIANFSYLSILQIVNMALPLITYPYLIKVLGTSNYGLVVFAQSIISYLVIILSFGFNTSATREISLNRNDTGKLSEIVSSVIIIKAILFMITIVLISLLIFIIPHAEDNRFLFFMTMWMCFYEWIFPVWYFQGIEKMKYITLITLISRISFVGLIFVYIHFPEDYILLPILNGVGALLSGLFSLYIVFRVHKIPFIFPNFHTLKKFFINSTPFFVANISSQLYVNSGKVIIGLVSNLENVAYYDLAEKIASFFKIPIQLVGQTLYPKVAIDKNVFFLNKVFRMIMLLSILLLAGGLIFSKHIIIILGGNQMLNSVDILRVLLLSIIPIVVSLFYANLMLISWGYNKEYLKVRIYSNVFFTCIVLILFGVSKVSLLALALATVLSEIFVAVLSVFYCRQHGLSLSFFSKSTIR